jgi:hypothetical protein
MAQTISKASTKRTIQLLTGTAGVNAGLAALTQGGASAVAAVSASQVSSQNVATDLAERSTAMQYPAVNVYCEKIVNNLEQKFQTFSGSAHMAIEIRHSQDGLAGLADTLELYADAVMQALDANRGDWGGGMYYAGGYQVAFSAVKHGGRNFVQTAKVTFEIGVGIN